MDAVDFVLENFSEMNKLWVRMQHQGRVWLNEKHEKERSELCDVVGKNLHIVSQIEGVDLEMYRDIVLPKVLDQVVNCKDDLAQNFLMECIIQVFPDEYHLQTLDILLDACAQLRPTVDIKTMLSQLIDRLSNYASNPEVLPEFLQVEAFAKLSSVIEKVINSQTDMPFVEAITLFTSLLRFCLRVHPDRLDNVDQVLRFGNSRLGDAVLRSRSLFRGSHWYWIGLGDLVGYATLFSVLFTFFLSYLQPLGRRQAVISKEELEERERQRRGEVVVIELRQFLQHSGSLTGKGFIERTVFV